MPPRLELFSVLRRRYGSSYFNVDIASNTRCFTSSPSTSATTKAQRRRGQDPYAAAQARALRAANLSRQEVLQTERSKALGDPVRGITTPFVESFDTAFPSGRDESKSERPTQLPEGGAEPTPHKFLNYFVSKDELNTALVNSEKMTKPEPYAHPSRDPQFHSERSEKHPKEHANALEAIQRITSIENGSSDDRTRINIQRCIDTFGRHNTEKFLRPKPGVELPKDPMVEGKTPRAGPDTGSSEVQIAILTSKIKTLADQLELRGKKDKVNKRNLRILVHKRQKLLKYLRRKERGGERWQFCIKTLGLTDGTWQGEISL